MNLTFKAGDCAMILTSTQPSLIGRSGPLIRKVEDNWKMLIEGKYHSVSEKSLMPLDGFNPGAPSAICAEVAA